MEQAIKEIKLKLSYISQTTPVMLTQLECW